MSAVRLLLGVLASVAGLAVSWGAAASAAAGPPQGRPTGSDPVLRALADKAVVEADAQKQFRASAQGRDQRARSVSAFRGQSDAAALDTARSQFGGLVNAPPLAWPVLRSGERVERVLDPRTALVREGSGKQGLFDSSIPLQGLTPTGQPALLDLNLNRHGSWWDPNSAPGGLRLPDSAAGNASFSGLGVSVHVAGAAGASAQIVGGKAFYPNVARDTDLVLRPTPDGVEVSLVLRSPSSPGDISLVFGLPAGDTLKTAGPLDSTSVPPGTVEVMQGARRALSIAPSAAVDAQGKEVPLTSELQGADTLVLHVAAPADVAWPVLVDPTIGVYDNYGQNTPTLFSSQWGYHTNNGAFGASTQNNALYLFAYSPGNNYYHYLDWSEWVRYSRPGAFIYRTNDVNASSAPYYDTHFGMPVTEAFEGIYDVTDNRWGDGNWWDTSNNGTGQGAIRNLTQTFQGDSAIICVPGCNPQSYVPQGSPSGSANAAVFGMNFLYNYILPPWTQGSVALGDAATYSSDNQTPSLNLVSHSYPPPSGWVNSYTDAVTMHSQLAGGLGMGTQAVSGAGLVAYNNSVGQPSLSVSNNCDGRYSDCPLTQDASVTYGLGPSTPDGPLTVTAAASDFVGNHDPGQDKSWTVYVDRTPPQVSLGAPPHAAGQTVTLTGSAVDVAGGNASQSSGVSAGSVAFQATDSAGTFYTLCSGLTPDANGNVSCSWNTASGAYPDDAYQVSLTAMDNAGNSATSPAARSIVDNQGPTSDTSGELDMARDEPRLTTDSPDLLVHGSDFSDAATATSGIQSLKVQIDGTDPSASNPYVTGTPQSGQPSNVWAQPGPCDSCEFEHDFQFDTSQFASGSHTVDVYVTDFAGNVFHQNWPFTIDRTSPKPSCSDPSADPNGCQSESAARTQTSCSVAIPTPSAPGGSVLTAAQAVAQTQQTMPSALAPSDQVNLESLNIAPSLTASTAGLMGYTSNATMIASVLGATAPTYTVGAAGESACISPATTSTVLAPQLVNGTAVEYPDTAPSTDTILRPTPLGVQDISQIRDAGAPQTQTYQVALAAGQYLSQLDDGSVAVIDPSLPSISSSLPDGASGPGSSDGPLDINENAPGFGTDGTSYDPAQYTPADTAGIAPAEPDVLPSQTQFQFENEDIALHTADQDTDGQDVALLSAPWAKDANGIDVPSSLAISGPNTVTYTTSHQGASHAYPVMSSHKAMATTASRRSGKKVAFQIDSQQPSGLSSQTNPPSGSGTPPEGVPRIIKARHITHARYIMYYQDSCDPYDQQNPTDLRPPSSQYPNGSPQYQQLQTDQQNQSSANYVTAVHCQRTLDWLNAALMQGLTPYITLEPDPQGGKLNKPNAYAASVARLWHTQPFSQVKNWGATNEPDLLQGTPKVPTLPSTQAAAIWRRIQALSTSTIKGSSAHRCPGCRIAAGEFSHYNPKSDTYVHAYMSYLKGNSTSHLARPFYWALHDYADVNYQDPNHPTPKYPQLRMFAALIKTDFSARPTIWLSEQGVELRKNARPPALSGDTTAIYGDATAQDTDAHRLLHLPAVVPSGYPQVSLNAYYMFFGSSSVFDSGLVAPPEASNPIGPNTTFRPAYCVLAGRLAYYKANSPCSPAGT